MLSLTFWSEPTRSNLIRLRKFQFYSSAPQELRNYVEKLIFDGRRDFEKFAADGADSFPMMLAWMIGAIRVRLSSGEFHIYRGRLSNRGQIWLSVAREMAKVVERQAEQCQQLTIPIITSHLVELQQELKEVG